MATGSFMGVIHGGLLGASVTDSAAGSFKSALQGVLSLGSFRGFGGFIQGATPHPCPPNALSNEHFLVDRIFWGPDQSRPGFGYRIPEVPNGVSNEHSYSDVVF